MDRPADRLRKLTVLAARAEGNERAVAHAKARSALIATDTQLLGTLAAQRQRLIAELRAESRRLSDAHARATKSETGALLTRALLLLQHYERTDALIAAVMLARLEAGHQLTVPERQQLDGHA